MTHSEVGGSAAPRFLRCLGSVELSRGLPNEDSEFSTRGHKAHERAAFHLQFGGQADGEDGEAINAYLDLINRLRTAYGPDRVEGIEYWFQCPDIDDRMFGQIDWWAINGPHGVIVDYKNGEGIPVEVEDNEQLLYYCRGLIEAHPEVEHWELFIQQREETKGPWDVPTSYVVEWANEKLIPAFVATRPSAPPAALVPGQKQCQFCPAALAGRCPVHTQQLMVYAEPDLPTLADMVDDDLDHLGGMLAGVYARAKAVKSELNKRLMRGTQFKSWKLVESKTDRVWKDDVPWGNYTHPVDWYMPQQVKSPAQIEKLGGRAFVKEWATKPAGYVTMAPTSDRRAAVAPPGTDSLFDMSRVDNHVE